MTFIWPGMLLLLLTVPVLVLIYLLIQRRRRRLANSYGGLGMAGADSGHGLAWRRHLPPAFFLLSLAALIVGLARPQAQVSLPRLEGTVILAFDVSGSMAADDIKPTRLEAAKAAAAEFVQAQPPTVQVGVVAFSDTGFSVQPPTNDQASVLAAIQRLQPARGTSLANGIYDALTVIAASTSPAAPGYYSALTPAPTPSPTPVPAGTYTPAVIILLTDGENNESPDPLAAAQAAADRGVRVHTIGLGSAAGTTVHVNGFTVHTQLYEAALKQISQVTGGTYYNATDAAELHKIYGDLGRQLIVKPQVTEVTSLFAGLGILVLLLGGGFSLLWFGRMP
jgi:Ca-activated chloride channel family protein